METVVVVGAKGMLGHKVVAHLSRDFAVVAADVEECDIGVEEETVRFVAAQRPRVVVNCAALTDVDGCERRADEAFRINGRGAGHVAAGAREAGAAVLQVSTDYVFDGRKKEPYVEEDPVAPLGVYGRSKLLGEQLVMEQNKRHWIVRTQWLYGPGGKNFVDTILALAAERPRLDVVDDQVGCPTYTEDLAGQMARIVALEPPFGVYHCSNNGSCSWFEFARRIVALAGKTAAAVHPMSSRQLGRPAPRPAFSILRNRRLEETIGDGMPDWEDGLRRYLAATGRLAGRSGADRTG